jgi:hypothetical protein
VAPKQAKKEKPDIEDALEGSDEEEVVEEMKWHGMRTRVVQACEGGLGLCLKFDLRLVHWA